MDLEEIKNWLRANATEEPDFYLVGPAGNLIPIHGVKTDDETTPNS